MTNSSDDKLLATAEIVLQKWKGSCARDHRLTFASVQARREGNGLLVEGEILNESMHDDLLAVLRLRLPGVALEDALCILMTRAARAAVKRAVTSIRQAPDEHSPLLTQALFGEELSILKVHEGWAFVRAAMDGYLGWAPVHAVVEQSYFTPPDHFVQLPFLRAYLAAESKRVVGILPFGVRVAVFGRQGEWRSVVCPDGTQWWIEAAGLKAIDSRPLPAKEDAETALDAMGDLVGTPYLWGGRSTFGFDCSGFSQTFMSCLGIGILRDADMQAGQGQRVEGPRRPGDLLFFGRTGYEANGVERAGGVNHVAISLGGDEFIHAASAVLGAAYGSLDSGLVNSDPDLRARFMGARRYF